MSDDHKREDDEPIEGRIPDQPEDGDFDDGFEGESDERDTRGGTARAFPPMPCSAATGCSAAMACSAQTDPSAAMARSARAVPSATQAHSALAGAAAGVAVLAADRVATVRAGRWRAAMTRGIAGSIGASGCSAPANCGWSCLP